MEPFRHILVPTSFSAASEAACWAAARMAMAFEARVTLLHVVDVPLPPFFDGAGMTTPDYVQPVLDDARIALEAARQRMGTNDAKLRVVLRLDSTSREILEAASACGADLIVMGTHCKPESVADWLARTTEKVVRRSPVPVMTVQAAAAAAVGAARDGRLR